MFNQALNEKHFTNFWEPLRWVQALCWRGLALLRGAWGAAHMGDFLLSEGGGAPASSPVCAGGVWCACGGGQGRSGLGSLRSSP